MARSETVWVVIHEGKPVAAFTVKHELRTWLNRFPPEGVARLRLNLSLVGRVGELSHYEWNSVTT